MILDNARALGQGDSISSRFIAAHATLDGSFHLACAPSVSVVALDTFRFAPQWPADEGYNPVAEIAGLGQAHLESAADACVVCQLGSGPGAMGELQAWTWSAPPKHFLYATASSRSVYYFALAGDQDRTASLAEMLQSSLCGPFGWVVFARSRALREAGCDGPELITDIAAHVTQVIVPALDGQGAVLWTPA
ncbi:MAG: hypothetical protein DWH87_00075 [Planctomycetota bacterium]|jgi:hypothetical protein|nr:MAG: hypothetical protein DWH87_00075 [Planctomycetota bacterium]